MSVLAIDTERCNPRYVAYAHSEGFDPDTMTAANKVLWPGACMYPYIAWNTAKLAEWKAAHGLGVWDHLWGDQQAEYTEWLLPDVLPREWWLCLPDEYRAWYGAVPDSFVPLAGCKGPELRLGEHMLFQLEGRP